MTSTEKIHETAPLSPEPIIIIIPDSAEGLCDPIPAGPVAAPPSPPPNVTQGKRNGLEESGTGRIEAPGRARLAARPRVRALGAAHRGIPVHVPLVALGSWLTGLCHWAVERLGSAVSVVHNACRDRITAIDCLWFGIRTAQLSCITGIVGIVGYYVLYPIYLGAAMVVSPAILNHTAPLGGCGVPLLRKVARMNDSGTPLPRIADYVERHRGRR